MKEEEPFFTIGNRSEEIKEYYKALFESRAIVDIAHRYGIDNPYKDNGIQTLQTLVILGLDPIEGRGGNDAKIGEREFELKTVNSNLTNAFSTNHHLSKKTLCKYRKVDWIFSIYHNLDLTDIWFLDKKLLEPYYLKWELLLHNKESLNNPKISISYVRKHGKCIFSKEDALLYKVKGKL